MVERERDRERARGLRPSRVGEPARSGRDTRNDKHNISTATTPNRVRILLLCASIGHKMGPVSGGRGLEIAAMRPLRRPRVGVLANDREAGRLAGSLARTSGWGWTNSGRTCEEWSAGSVYHYWVCMVRSTECPYGACLGRPSDTWEVCEPVRDALHFRATLYTLCAKEGPHVASPRGRVPRLRTASLACSWLHLSWPPRGNFPNLVAPMASGRDFRQGATLSERKFDVSEQKVRCLPDAKVCLVSIHWL